MTIATQPQQPAAKIPHAKASTDAIKHRLQQHNRAAREPMKLSYGPAMTATPSQRQYTVDVTKNGHTKREVFKTEAAWLKQLNFIKQNTQVYDAKIQAIDLIAGRQI